MTFRRRVVPSAAYARYLAEGAARTVIDWLTTTDHKKIGIMYVVATLAFFVVAGVLALLIRAQLAAPDNTFLGPHAYNQVFTLHGTAMIFFFIAPFGLGLANFLMPLQIGAPDMAFPRLNATALWLFVFGGLTVFAGWRPTAARRRPAGPPTRRSRRSHIGTGAGKICGSSGC